MPKKCLSPNIYRIFLKFKLFYCKICDFIPFNTPWQQIITLIFFKSNLFYCKIHDFIAYNLPPPTNNYIKFFNLNLFFCKLNNFIPSPTYSHATTGNPIGISLTIIKRRPCHFLTQTPLKLSLFLHFYYIFPIFYIYCIYTTFPHFFPILHLHYFSTHLPYTISLTLLFPISSLYYFSSIFLITSLYPLQSVM